MALTNTFCPKCGNQTQVDTASTLNFCRYCGNPLRVQEAPSAASFDQLTDTEQMYREAQKMFNSSDYRSCYNACDNLCRRYVSFLPGWALKIKTILNEPTLYQEHFKDLEMAFDFLVKKVDAEKLESIFTNSAALDIANLMYLTFLFHIINQEPGFSKDDCQALFKALVIFLELAEVNAVRMNLSDEMQDFIERIFTLFLRNLLDYSDYLISRNAQYKGDAPTSAALSRMWYFLSSFLMLEEARGFFIEIYFHLKRFPMESMKKEISPREIDILINHRLREKKPEDLITLYRLIQKQIQFNDFFGVEDKDHKDLRSGSFGNGNIKRALLKSDIAALHYIFLTLWASPKRGDQVILDRFLSDHQKTNDPQLEGLILYFEALKNLKPDKEVKQTIAENISKLERAIGLGFGPAASLLGHLLTSDWKEDAKGRDANAILNEGVNLKDLNSMTILGIHALHGIGMERNYDLAYDLFDEAKTLGDINSYRNLAYMCNFGLCVAKDAGWAKTYHEKWERFRKN